jgi:hypothetical protein
VLTIIKFNIPKTQKQKTSIQTTIISEITKSVKQNIVLLLQEVKVLCRNHWLQLVLSNESAKFMRLGNSFIFAMHLHNSFIFSMHLCNSFIFNMHLWNSCMLALDADTEDANAEDADAKVD